MDAERYQRLKRIVFAASDLPAAARPGFLDRECGADRALREEAAALLAPLPLATRAALGPVRGPTEPGLAHGAAAAPATLPARLGEHVLGRELGRGGMGLVHEAVHARTGERVAVKVLHPHLLASPAAVERFRREARLGASIAHGGVVRTLDVGCEPASGDGPPLHYIVMELAEGSTLRSLIDDLGRLPEALVREVGRQAAVALAAIHAAGVVHRDVKPENVLLAVAQPGAGEHRVRLMDLGVARALESSVSLTADGQFVGSVAHAAPEQFDGEDVGPAADLYALGVTLLEAVTGSNPFRRASIAATVRAHLEEVPPLASATCPDVSPFLAHVLARLLERRPSARFASALEVARVLAEGERGAWWSQVEAARAAPAPLVPVERATALHGRDAESAAIASAWRRASAQLGGALLVEGPAGAGKTRLADDACRAASAEGARVAYADAAAGGARAAVRALARGLEARTLESDEVRRDAEALGRSVGDMARERPVLLVLDGVDAGGAEAWDAAEALARAVRGTRALLLVLARPGSPRRDALLDVAGTRHVRLDPLGPEAVQALVADRLEDAALAARLAPAVPAPARPGEVLDRLAALERDGLLGRDADGAWTLARDPAAAIADEASLDVRLAAVPVAERGVLDVLAAADGEIGADVLAAALGLPLVRVLQALAELERRHRLVRSRARSHRVEGPSVRAAVRAAWDAAARTRIAADLGRALADRARAADDGMAAAQAARLLLEADLADEAAPLAPAGVEALAAAGRLDDALRLCALAAACEPALAPGDRVRLLAACVAAATSSGRHDEAARAAAELERLGDGVGDPALRARAAAARGTAAWHAGDLARSVELLEQARALAREAGDGPLELRAARNLASALTRTGRADEALALARWCGAAAREAGDVLTEAIAANNAAGIHVGRGEHALALEGYAEAARLAREAGDVRVEAHAEGGVALACAHLGRFDEAVERGLRQVRLAERAGDRRAIALGLGYVGVAELERGRLAAAIRRCAASADALRVLGERRAHAIAASNLGFAQAMAGATAAARASQQQALAVLEDAGDARVAAQVLLRLALVDEQDGRAEAALERARESVAMASSGPAQDAESIALSQLELARLLDGAGDASGALAALERALEAAAGVENPTVRVLAALSCAVARGGDPADACAALERAEPVMGVADRLRARHLAWRATSDVAHLAAAHELLDRLRAHAPRSVGGAVVTRVPLHRLVADAWSLHAPRRGA